MVTRRNSWLIASWLTLGVAMAVCEGCGAASIVGNSAAESSSDASGVASSSSDDWSAPTSADDAGSALFAWWTGGANTVFKAISGDDSDIAAAASNEDVIGMQSACEALQSDVEQAQAYTSAPDPAVQSSLTEALAMYARSATDCIAGTTTMSPELINQASDEMTQGTTALEGATARIQSLGGN